MNKIVTIGGKEIGVSVSALTSVKYTELFHKDFNSEIQKISTDMGVLKEITYIMAMRYQAQSMDEFNRSLSLDGYAEWLEQFGMFDFELSGAQIADLITEQSKTTVVPKG
jgi:hypothetical protein